MDREFTVSNFTRVYVRFAMDIEVVRADAPRVSVSGNETQVNNIQFTQEGDRITLGYKVNLASIVMAPFSRIHARIELPELSELNITGAARGKVSGFSIPGDFTLVVAGASRLDLDQMSVGSMKWDLSGASRVDGRVEVSGDTDIKIAGAGRIDLKGTTHSLKVDATGASHVDLEDFKATEASIKATGASHCTAAVSGKLDVNLEGASRLEYEGNPTMGDVKIVGASSFRHR